MRRESIPHLRRLALRARVTGVRSRRKIAKLILLSTLTADCGATHGHRTAPANAPITSPAQQTTAASTTTPPPAGKPVTTGFDPVSFTAISPDDFWLLSAAPYSNPVCATIVRSTDGGRHFAEIPAPPVVVSSGDDSSKAIDTLRFATSLDGFAFDAQSSSAPSTSSFNSSTSPSICDDKVTA